jgi:hypothetical protein
LYRPLDSTTWSKLELVYDPLTAWASAVLPDGPGQYEFFVQAVDAAGNVAIALDHNHPFQALVQALVCSFMPLTIIP